MILWCLGKQLAKEVEGIGLKLGVQLSRASKLKLHIKSLKCGKEILLFQLQEVSDQLLLGMKN